MVYGKQIVVLTSGFVHVGDVESDAEGGGIIIRNAKNIRRYGTTQGLGELRTGPRTGTVLDEMGTLYAHWGAVIFRMDTEATLW